MANDIAADELYLARLAELVARQRQEIGGLHRAAAARSLTDLARGMLMERLGCSPAEAGRELDRIAQETGTRPAELAAQIAGQRPLPDDRQPLAELPELRALAACPPLPDASDLAVALLSEALADAGAAAVLIWLTAPDGAMELAGQAGLPASEASRWQRVPPGVDVPAVRASTGGGETWWPDGPTGAHTALAGPWPGGARCVVPVRLGGLTLGALEACWREPIGEFTPALRRQIGALAELSAQALGSPGGGGQAGPDGRASWVLGLLDALAEPVLLASAVRDDEGQVVDFRLAHVAAAFSDPAGRSAQQLAGESLLAAYPAAARPGGLFDLAVTALSSGQPQELSGADAPAPAAIAAQRLSVRIAPLHDGVIICWRQEAEPERAVAMLELFQRLGRVGGWEEEIGTGAAYWMESTFELFGVRAGHPVGLGDLEHHVAAADIPAVAAFRSQLLSEKTAAAAAFRVIRADDGSIRQVRAFAEPVLSPSGEVIAVRGAYQDISARYHAEVALAVTRDQLTGSEQRVAEEHKLALELQEAITPHASSQLVEAASLAVAARYRPAGAGHLVSGDWYDSTRLPSNQVMLVVGDVAGHGIPAVTGMVTLRNSLRGLAMTGAGPGRLLALLNGVACHLTEDVMGTAICCLYDPARGRLVWARAGHLPPVLVRGGTARQLRQPRGLLLGADPDASYEEVTTQLHPGDTLLLYTDGLIERRDQAIDTSLDTLLAVAARQADDIDEIADGLLEAMASDTGDDACLLAVRLR